MTPTPPEEKDRTREEVMLLLDLVQERGAGLVVIVTNHIADGHALIEVLGEQWGAAVVVEEQAFQPLSGRPRLVWDLPFLDTEDRRGALVRLNRARDRLAGLAAPVVLWVLDDDLALCWRAAQELMDWASEMVQ